MITTIAVALLNPMQVAENTVVPNAPSPSDQSYDWKVQKGQTQVFSGSWTQTGSFGGSAEDWHSDM